MTSTHKNVHLCLLKYKLTLKYIQWRHTCYVVGLVTPFCVCVCVLLDKAAYGHHMHLGTVLRGVAIDKSCVQRHRHQPAVSYNAWQTEMENCHSYCGSCLSPTVIHYTNQPLFVICSSIFTQILLHVFTDMFAIVSCNQACSTRAQD